MRTEFSARWSETMDQLHAEGISYAQMAVDLDVTVQTLYNWRNPEKANVTLDTYEMVADYAGWKTQIKTPTRTSNRWSRPIVLDLRKREPELVLP